MEKKKHRHKFVPVEIGWKSYWSAFAKGKRPVPVHVILACRCGAVKLVPAKLVRTSKEIIEQGKNA